MRQSKKNTKATQSIYNLSLDAHKEGLVWVLSGDLIFETLPGKLAEFESKRPVRDNLSKVGAKQSWLAWEVNCRELNYFDSSGAAFLLSCVRYAKDNKFKLQLIDLPEEIYSLLQVQGISGLLLPLARDLVR
jgi:ABC-type transporter Mla MlaB component